MSEADAIKKYSSFIRQIDSRSSSSKYSSEARSFSIIDSAENAHALVISAEVVAFFGQRCFDAVLN